MCKLKVTTHTANNELLSHHVVPLFKNYIAGNNNSFLPPLLACYDCLIYLNLFLEQQLQKGTRSVDYLFIHV